MTTAAVHSGRGRPGRPKSQVEMEVEPELDAELEEEMDEEDLTLYCFCQKRSYGDVSGYCLCPVSRLLKVLPVQMIGCDNADCPYQWVTSLSLIWLVRSALINLDSSISDVSALNHHSQTSGIAQSAVSRGIALTEGKAGK
jgi:hypothetical protein